MYGETISYMKREILYTIRQYHILNPKQKEMMKKSGRFKRHFERYYQEGDKVWKDKIGDIDIAKYHLLIYGE
jgi:hypothetical protein